MNRQGLNFKVLPNGNLSVSLTSEGRRELREMRGADKTENEIWSELIEQHSCNGSYCMLPPEATGSLTDAPMIGDNIEWDDEHTYVVNDDAKVWWFPNYMIQDPLSIMLKEKRVIFTSAENS